jgi:small subunit ribosomal protein S6
MTKTYELTVLVSPSFTLDEVKAVSTSITKLAVAKNGKVLKEENWGKKFLAYKLKKETEAVYLYFELSLDTSVAQAFEHEILLMDTVMRSLFVIKEGKQK